MHEWHKRIYENLQNNENRTIQSGDAIDQNEDKKKRGINWTIEKQTANKLLQTKKH